MKLFLMIAYLFILTCCGTTYKFIGKSEIKVKVLPTLNPKAEALTKNSAQRGKQKNQKQKQSSGPDEVKTELRTLILEWQRTDYPLGLAKEIKDNQMLLSLQCSDEKIIYTQTEQGIRALNENQKYARWDDKAVFPESCGQVMGFRKIASIEAEPVQLIFSCQGGDLPGSLEAMAFQVEKRKVAQKEVLDKDELEIKKLLSCPTNL